MAKNSATSHEAAQKKIWKAELRDLRKQADQHAAAILRETRAAGKRVADCRKALAKAEREEARLRKRLVKSATLKTLEHRIDALRGRIES